MDKYDYQIRIKRVSFLETYEYFRSVGLDLFDKMVTLTVQTDMMLEELEKINGSDGKEIKSWVFDLSKADLEKRIIYNKKVLSMYDRAHSLLSEIKIEAEDLHDPELASKRKRFVKKEAKTVLVSGRSVGASTALGASTDVLNSEQAVKEMKELKKP